MQKDLDDLNIEFDATAKETFYEFYERFEKTVQELSRNRNENVFQQERAKYSNSLKTELEKLALSIIEKNHELKEFSHLRRNLTNRIQEYVQEFLQKTQSI
jgi:hypothetical protein